MVEGDVAGRPDRCRRSSPKPSTDVVDEHRSLHAAGRVREVDRLDLGVRRVEVGEREPRDRRIGWGDRPLRRVQIGVFR
jgi:hypothetical protein